MRVKREDLAWHVEQVLLDPEEQDDAVVVFAIDLEKSRAERRPALALERVEI